MTDQQHYQTAALHCSERISLPLRNHVWKGQSGDFLGAGSGSSMDFQDHRNYSPGDDPRHINWQAYARTGNYTMKQYREEVRPTIDLILDISPSMFFEETKKQRSSELLYLIHAIAMKNGADLSCHLIQGNQYVPLSNDSIQSGHWSRHISPKVDESLTHPPAIELVPVKHNSIRVFISDLLFEGDPAPVVQSLVRRQGKLILLAPFLKSEANPDWQGNYDFIDAELQSKHAHRVDASTLSSYKKQYRNHFQLWLNAMQKHHAPMARVCANDHLFDSLQPEAIKNQALQLINA